MIAIKPPPHSPKGQEVNAFARRTLEKLLEHSPNTVPDDHRSLVFAMFNAVAIQHFHAIIILAEARMTPATTMALFRPFVEAVVRGHWLWTSQSEELIEEFLTNPEFTFSGFRKLAKEVGERTGLLDHFQPFIDEYGGMCDFTHTGIRQITIQFSTEDGVGPTLDEGLVVNFVRESTKFALLHSIIACQHRGDMDGATALQEWSSQLPA